MFVGSQFMSSRGANRQRDNLITSEFVQAVEQGAWRRWSTRPATTRSRAPTYPAATAGATAADAFNSAFDALNARMATLKAPTARCCSGGHHRPRAGHSRCRAQLHVHLRGAGLARRAVGAHPDTQYQVTLPSPFLQIHRSRCLPMLHHRELLLFFFTQMQKANNSQMNFGKNKTKKPMEERPT